MEQFREQKDLIFALDIGTRNIIGIIGKEEEGKFNILDYRIKSHNKRNMYDGQIHDIEGVARLVSEIKSDLEVSNSIKLEHVALAAAGRALKTEKLYYEMDLDKETEIELFHIENLELNTLNEAKTMIEDGGQSYSNFKYYSIGYTVMNYYLDGDKIKNPAGHKAKKIGVEILATFLPKIVVEGLYSVIAKVGLEITSITLEPIAGINVSIKEELRLLNLALVDIGAGTSDIAITKNGEISYYGMTQVAGDEVTETLIKKYLLDFNQSEDLKLDLDNREEFLVKNILGMESTLTREDILDSIEDVLDEIAGEIANEILEFNGKGPDAVFLIGGSSKLPTIGHRISEKLGIPKERVAIRNIELLDNVICRENLSGPDMVTAVGIGLEAGQRKYRNFIEVDFNGQVIKIFNTENIKVSDILIMSGFNPKDLLPVWSEDIVYFINGKKRKIKGLEGSRPIISLNGQEASLKSEVGHNSKIEIIRSKPAKALEIKLSKILSDEEKKSDIRVNGQFVDLDYIIRDRDEIETIIGNLDRQVEKNLSKPIKKDKNYINLNINGDNISIAYGKDEFTFADVFDHIDFDLTKLKGSLVTLINGQRAEYMKALKSGDRLDIYWE